MTNEEAINILNQDKDISFQGLIDDDLLTEEDIEHIEAYEMATNALKGQNAKLMEVCRNALIKTLDEIFDHMCPEVITDSSGDTHGYYPENYEEYEKMFEIIKRNFKDIYPDLFKGGINDKKGIC